MRALGWALIHYDWCPYKKRRLGHRHIQRKDHVRTQVETDIGKQGERPQKDPALPTLWSWTSSLQNCEEIDFCCLSYLVWYFVMAALAN